MTVASHAASGALHRDRVAELIVTHAGGQRRASGYLVCPGAVLTAAHAVAGATGVRVRFEPDLPGEWVAEAESWWRHPSADIAIVSIAPQARDVPPAPARLGRIGQDAAVLRVQAVGFPRWKLRDDERPERTRYRDACHALGTVATLSNWREGTLEVVLDAAPAPDEEPAVSPWEGMSGAALWAGDRIVGVVSRHHPGDGLARLAAGRLDIALDGLPAPDRADLRALLPQLPEHARDLPDVVAASPGQVTLSDYRDLLTDIAPDDLRDRDHELGELVRFCAGDEAYLWWQAGPWAGKSALLSWFALDPPAGADVVSFFITSRFAGQSDSDACTDSLIEQLTALLGEPAPRALEARDRHREYLRLLNAAAARAGEVGRRLLLVVDGLDEDTSRAGGRTLPSIAALLPRRPPAGLRILVASRPHPGLPGDVPGNHPLRGVVPRVLTPSPHALHIKLMAKEELTLLLRGSPLNREVIGLVAAAGGGLTLSDLGELTGRPPYDLDWLLSGSFGRTVGSRTSTTPVVGRPPEPIYLFTHETIRQLAGEQLGNELADYRDQLHGWADRYRERGWPADTPNYLLRGYAKMLAETEDLPRLVRCATDRVRHGRMRELTGGDAPAVIEITAATSLLREQSDPDVAILLHLALARDNVAQRNAAIPVELPALWATFGQPSRAVALANGIPDADRRIDALSHLIPALADAGEHERAEALLGVGASIAAELGSPAWAQSRFVAEAARIGDLDQAVRLAGQVTEDWERQSTLAYAATTAGFAGHHEAAAALVSEIADPGYRTEALCDLARSALDGDPPHAAALADEAEATVTEIVDAVGRDERLVGLVTLLADLGQSNRAADLSAKIGSPVDQTRALISVVEHSADPAHHALAARAAEQIYEPDVRTGLLCDLVAAAGRDRFTAFADVAERAVLELTDPHARSWQLGYLVQAVLEVGDRDRARRLAAEIDDPLDRAHAVARVSQAAPGAALNPVEVQAATRLSDPASRAEALAVLAESAAHSGDRAQAADLARQAESAARQVRGGRRAGDAILSQVARAMAAAGEHDRALQLAREITQPGSRAGVLRDLADSADRERALVIIEQIREPAERAGALTARAKHEAAAGNLRDAADLAGAAERAATEPSGPDEQARGWILERIAEAAQRRDVARVAQVARELVDPPAPVGVFDPLAAALLAGDQDAATRLAQGVSDPAAGVWALGEVARATGPGDRATAFLDALADVARKRSIRADRATLLCEAARVAAAVGDTDRAVALADAAAAAARKISSRTRRSFLACEVARTAIAVGNPACAVAAAATAENAAAHIRVLAKRAQALSHVAQVSALLGDAAKARELAGTAETVAESVSDRNEWESAMSELPAALGAVGEIDRAVRIFRTLTQPGPRAQALGALALVLDPAQRPAVLDALKPDLLDILTTEAWPRALPAVDAEALARLARAVG